MGDDRDNGRQVMGTHPPDVDIRYPVVWIRFDYWPDLLHGFRIDTAVHQHPAAVDQQAVGPAADDQGTDDAHDRVHPDPAEALPADNATIAGREISGSASRAMEPNR